ncbi:MAG: hypothetical protein ACP5QX_05145 [Caldisericaceae bacterium]
MEMEEIISKWVLQVILNHIEEIEKDVIETDVDTHCEKPLPLAHSTEERSKVTCGKK